MASAGYPDGFDTTLTVINVTGYTDVCQVIVEQLAQIGVNVTLNPVEAASYANYIAAWGGGMLMHPMGMEKRRCFPVRCYLRAGSELRTRR